MRMLEYAAAVKRGLRDVHGLTPTGGTDQEPTFDNIPDGEYPMEINGEIDRVRVTDDRLFMCNFDEDSPRC